MNINIHVPVSTQSLPYYFYLLKNYTSLASKNHQLNFYAHCLDADYCGYFPRVPDVLLNTPNCSHTAIQLETSRGSDAHASAVMSALQWTNNKDVTLIADADTVMLAKNWDEKVLELLDDNVIVGTTYEDIGGFSSGPGPIQTYKGKPNATWMALSPETNWKDLRVEASKQSNLKVTDERLSKLWNLPMGFELLRDVGWQIPEYIDNADCVSNYVAFKHVKPTRGAKAIITGHDYHEEYWLPDETPFIAHQRGSMKHAFRNSPISTPFYDACDRYIKSL